MRKISVFLIIIVLMSTHSSATGFLSTSVSTISITPSDDIQHVIDTIPPLSTIILTPGEYHQSFTIPKQITITSTNPVITIINVTTQKNKPAITITAPNVTFSNITIINNGPGLYTSGIRILDDYTTINNCIFQDTPIGISVWSNYNTIHTCTFHNCSDEGIVLLTTSFSTAYYNTISSSIFTYNCDAIELQQSCYNIIKDCVMQYNTHSGIDAIDKNNNMNYVSNCTITNNNVHGIYFTHSKENIIDHCIIKNNIDGDIVTPYSQNTTVIPIVDHPKSLSEPTVQDIHNGTINKAQDNNQKQSPSFLRQIISHIINIIRNF